MRVGVYRHCDLVAVVNSQLGLQYRVKTLKKHEELSLLVCRSNLSGSTSEWKLLGLCSTGGAGHWGCLLDLRYERSPGEWGLQD